MSSTVAKKAVGIQEAIFTLEFLFNSGSCEPSTIAGIPRSQIYRFGCEDLMDWMKVSEEEAVEIIDGLLTKLDEGKGSKHSFVFPEGQTFTITLDSE